MGVCRGDKWEFILTFKEVAAWGRRRWNIEGGFRVEKHGGFGMEHTFCNDDTAGRTATVLPWRRT